MNRKTIEKFRDLVISLIIAFGSLGILTYSYNTIVTWQFGKTYPDNHVYQALLAANADIRAGRATEIRNRAALGGYDVTGQFRNAAKGITFDKLVAEFRELGMPDGFTPAQYIPGEEYSLGLPWDQISALRIPGFGFWSLDQVTLEVRIKFNSGTDYRILKSRITGTPRFVL